MENQNRTPINRDELYEVMNEITEVEYGIQSLAKFLEITESYYEMEYNEELLSHTNVILRQLNSLHNDLAKAISKIDSIIISK